MCGSPPRTARGSPRLRAVVASAIHGPQRAQSYSEILLSVSLWFVRRDLAKLAYGVTAFGTPRNCVLTASFRQSDSASDEWTMVPLLITCA